MSMENPSYNISSIEHPDMPEGGRSLDNYEALFGSKREELEGMRIADLGSGTRFRFDRGLRDAIADTAATAISGNRLRKCVLVLTKEERS